MIEERLLRVKYAGICAYMRGVRHFWGKVPEILEGGWNGTVAAFECGSAGSAPACRASGQRSLLSRGDAHPAIGKRNMGP